MAVGKNVYRFPEEQTVIDDNSISFPASSKSTISQEVPSQETSQKNSILPVVAGTFHIIASVLTLAIFLWHFTPAADKLPGARWFGWFFKFLTFWGWTTQTIQFLLLTIHRCTPKSAKFRRAFTRLTDDFSCMAFVVAMIITVQFWVLHLVTGGLVEKSKDRPPWLGFSVHVLNACLALTDVLLSSPRTFSTRSKYMLVGYTLAYSCFLLSCRYMNGKFPYPFMNKIHPAFAFFSMLCVTLIVLQLVFAAGAALSATANRAFSKQEVHLVTPHSKGGVNRNRKEAAKRNGHQPVRQGGPVLRNGKNSTE